MAKRFVIVDRTVEPDVKPEYTDLTEATQRLLAVRKGVQNPEAFVLVEIDDSAEVVTTRDLVVTENVSAVTETAPA